MSGDNNVRRQSANVDATGWRQGRQRGWVWIVVTRAVTAFTIALSRAASVARGLIDPAAGQVITTDRYEGYLWLPPAIAALGVGRAAGPGRKKA
jgi:hypothetical protein